MGRCAGLIHLTVEGSDRDFPDSGAVCSEHGDAPEVVAVIDFGETECETRDPLVFKPARRKLSRLRGSVDEVSALLVDGHTVDGSGDAESAKHSRFGPATWVWEEPAPSQRADSGTGACLPPLPAGPAIAQVIVGLLWCWVEICAPNLVAAQIFGAPLNV